jgi:hypothetical protein
MFSSLYFLQDISTSIQPAAFSSGRHLPQGNHSVSLNLPVYRSTFRLRAHGLLESATALVCFAHGDVRT